MDSTSSKAYVHCMLMPKNALLNNYTNAVTLFHNLNITWKCISYSIPGKLVCMINYMIKIALTSHNSVLM